jgi:outer membrane protein OmpA-like peptidoglycan-associated protein
MTLRSCLLPLALLASSPVWAEAVDVSLNGRALAGQGVPQVNVHILEPIKGFQLKLKRSDGTELSIKGGGGPGQTRVIDLDQPEGKFNYSGELIAHFPDGSSSSMPLQFDTEMYGPLKMKMEKDDVDVAGRKVTFRLTRPAGKANVKVLMDTGRYAMDGDVNFNGEPADTPLEVTWPEVSGKVMKIAIKAYDTSTFFTGVEVFPWQVDIPHEEVNFDSGKWEIRAEENEKIDKSFRAISEAVSKYGKLADIKLFIAGHTDTVGANAGNRTLSLNRARSIGAYFRKRGVRIPILYEGFGEEALLAPTPDETAEVRNRRAEYIISVEQPALKNSPVQAKWQRL